MEDKLKQEPKVIHADVLVSPLGAVHTSGAPVVDVDPFSDEFFEDPYRIHELLREAGPAVWLPRWSVHAVARYEEVRQVLNDPGTFCSGRGVGLSDFAKEAPWRPKSLILEADPPEHGRARAVLSRVLSASVMKKLRQGFQATALQLADELVARREIDGIADLAEAFPLSVFPDAVGLCREGREHLLPYASLAFNAFGPPNTLREKAFETAAPHVKWVTEQCRRENLTSGGLGAAIYSAADAGDISEEEALLLVRSLLSAGLDTTVNGIGAAIYCLARFPKAWQDLRSEVGLARATFEEAVRFESPVQTFFRTTTRAVEFGGVHLAAGSKVLMFLGAANRDPRRWDDPERYVPTRSTAGHVGFGSGIHMCAGQLLSRLEGEVLLAALATKVDTLKICGPVVRRYNNTLRGLERLPIALTAA